MTFDQKRLAEALAIERLYGTDGPLWIAERIGVMAAAGDGAGVKRFRAIAAAYQTLLVGPIH